MSGQEELCRVVKHGRVDLYCTRPDGHEGWHEAAFSDSQEIIYPGAHHIVRTEEHVTWEPVDHVKEAVRQLIKGSRAGQDEERAEPEP